MQLKTLTIISLKQEDQVRALPDFVVYDPEVDQLPDDLPNLYVDYYKGAIPYLIIGRLPDSWLATSTYMPDGYWWVINPAV